MIAHGRGPVVAVLLWCGAVSVATAQDSAPTASSTRPATATATRPETETRPTEALAIEGALRARLREPMPSLDLDLAMFGDEFFGTKPESVRFTDDGRSVVFSWRRPEDERRGTFVYDLAAGTLVRLADSDAGPRFGVLDRKRERRLVVKGRALVLESFRGDPPLELARFDATPSDPRFGADEDVVYCTTDRTLWRIPLRGPGMHVLLTTADGESREPKPASRPTDSRATRLAEQFRRQETAWFRVLFERQQQKSAETRPKRADDVEVHRFEAPPGETAASAVVAPRGDYAVVTTYRRPSTSPREDRVPHFITEDGYMSAVDARAKAGDARGASSMHVIDLGTGASVPIVPPADPAGLEIGGVFWSDDGRQCVAEARSFDREHRTILRVDPKTGATTLLFRDDDPAWVLGFGTGFVPGTALFAFTSEKSGYRALHVVDAETAAVRAFGAGYESSQFWFSADGKSILATSTIDTPHAKEIVRFDVLSGEAAPLTADGGLRELVVSPDGAAFAEVRSKPDRPWELYLRRADAMDRPVKITTSPSPAFSSYSGWRTPPIVRVAGEGGSFPARYYAPTSGRKGGPGVVFIHGAGYLQNVHDGWSQYQREYAFHHVLADRGFAVLDIDFRGSAGYGRDFRAAVKGRIGDLDTLDVVAAARHLVQEEGCDPTRIHCYGGSYGGFLTLMALFRHPGVFASGAALRPVTDWSHYHEGYTANLLDDPLENEDTYRRASPITYASGLRDRLLICHGLVDDNVFPHDTVRLTQRLIELRKPGFEVMLYPWEPHSFVDAASWSDEYRRILELFERPPLPR